MARQAIRSYVERIMTMLVNVVEAPAHLQDECVVEAPVEGLRGTVNRHVKDVFGAGMIEVSPGVWRRQSVTRDQHIGVTQDGARARLSVGVNVRISPLRKVGLVALWSVTVGAWAATAITTFIEFRSSYSNARIVLWLGLLVASFALTPVALRMAVDRSVDVTADVKQMQALLARVEADMPRGMVAR